MAPAIFADNADLQFVDYTKSPKRALEHARGQLPANYHLTFSRSETNESDCLRVLEAGGNVAVVFAGAFPASYLGFPVIDGDRARLAPSRRARSGRGAVAQRPQGESGQVRLCGAVMLIALALLFALWMVAKGYL